MTEDKFHNNIQSMEEHLFIKFMEAGVRKFKTKFDDIDTALHLTELCETDVFDLELACLEVKESTIHGSEVFATVPIKKGMIVAIYPCHGVIVNNRIKAPTKYKPLMDNFDPVKYKFRLKGSLEHDIVGFPSIQTKYLIGHMINDSCLETDTLLQFNQQTTVTEYGKAFVAYLLNGTNRNNCTIVACENYAYIKTIRDLLPGEELLTSYDIMYWVEQLSVETQIQLLTTYINTLSHGQKQWVYKLMTEFGLEYI